MTNRWKGSDKYKRTSKAVERFLQVYSKLTHQSHHIQDIHFALVNLAAHYMQWVEVEIEIQNSDKVKELGYKSVREYMISMKLAVRKDFEEDLPKIKDFKGFLKEHGSKLVPSGETLKK